MANFPLYLPQTSEPDRYGEIDWASPINRGLVHYWPMWERSGTKVEEIVGGLDGEHFVSNPPFSISTKEGQALSSPSGDPGQFNTASAPTFSGTFTCEFLFRRHSGTGFGTIASTGGNDGFFTTGGSLVYYAGGSKAASAITNNEMTHVVASFSPNGANVDLQFYINGKASGSATNFSSNFTPNNFGGHGSEYLIGDIVYFKIYKDVTKTAAEARSLYNNTWQAFKPQTQFVDISSVAPSGRIMSSLANHGGLAGHGGIAGIGGGLAG